MRKNGRTYRQTDRKTDRHDETNSRFLHFAKASIQKRKGNRNLDTEGHLYISGIFGLVACYEALMGSYLPMFLDIISVPSSTVQQSKKFLLDPCNRVRYVVRKLRQLTSRTAKTSFTPRQKPEITHFQKGQDTIYTKTEAWNHALPEQPKHNLHQDRSLKSRTSRRANILFTPRQKPEITQNSEV
jgi:hypothetical protein